jgi:hypothetical protein
VGVTRPTVWIFLGSKKRIIRITTNSKNTESCREPLKNWKIIPLYSLYTFILLLFVTKNKDQYKSNQETHSINTRYSIYRHPPIWNLTTFHREAYYFGSKVFSQLLSSIKSLFNEMKLFRPSFIKFLLSDFCPIHEYFKCNSN